MQCGTLDRSRFTAVATLFCELANSLLNVVLQGRRLRGGELLLVGVTAMIVASKYEENSEQAWWFFTQNGITREQIVGMEQVMLTHLSLYSPEEPRPLTPGTEEETAEEPMDDEEEEEEEEYQAFSEMLLDEQDVQGIDAYLRSLEVIISCFFICS